MRNSIEVRPYALGRHRKNSRHSVSSMLPIWIEGDLFHRGRLARNEDEVQLPECRAGNTPEKPCFQARIADERATLLAKSAGPTMLLSCKRRKTHPQVSLQTPVFHVKYRDRPLS